MKQRELPCEVRPPTLRGTCCMLILPVVLVPVGYIAYDTLCVPYEGRLVISVTALPTRDSSGGLHLLLGTSCMSNLGVQPWALTLESMPRDDVKLGPPTPPEWTATLARGFATIGLDRRPGAGPLALVGQCDWSQGGSVTVVDLRDGSRRMEVLGGAGGNGFGSCATWIDDLEGTTARCFAVSEPEMLVAGEAAGPSDSMHSGRPSPCGA